MAEKMRKTFWGSQTDNTCAYCYKHHLSLTPSQLKKRGCLSKQCNALQICEHPMWEQRDRRKEMRKERKKRIEENYKKAVHG